MFNYEELKPTTKKAIGLVDSFEYCKNHGLKTLSQCYGRCSTAKVNAYNDCLSNCRALNGTNFTVVSHNCNFFSVAFETASAVYYITASHNYMIPKVD